LFLGAIVCHFIFLSTNKFQRRQILRVCERHTYSFLDYLVLHRTCADIDRSITITNLSLSSNATMPPQATDVGFRYTPSSYLQRTRLENRPWGEDGDEGVTADELNSGALAQELRPAKKETSIDSHFQSRVQRRKEAYRSILKGEAEMEEMEELTPEKVDEEHVLHAPSVTSAKSEAARQARQKRLSGKEQFGDSDNSESVRVRNMRAHRLRNSLKASVDEQDAMEVIRQRRQQQIELDRLERSRMQQDESEERLERLRTEEERKSLSEERNALEQAKRWAAADLVRRQPPSPSSLDAEAPKPKRKARRVRNMEEEEEDVEEDLFFLDELRLLLRESGLMRSCVMSCFGADEAVETTHRSSSSRRRRRRTSREESDRESNEF
jgi:hypothetical protein